MEWYNWILAKKRDGIIVKVRQKEPFSDSFIDEYGNIYKINQIDMVEEHISLKKSNEEDIEYGLEGYRAIYG